MSIDMNKVLAYVEAEGKAIAEDRQAAAQIRADAIDEGTWPSKSDTGPAGGKTSDSSQKLFERILDRLTVKDSNDRSWLNKDALGGYVDASDVWKTILASFTDVQEDLLTGAAGIVEGVADAGAMIAPVLLGTDKEKATEFVAKDFIDEQNVVRELLSNLKGLRQQDIFAQIDRKGYVSDEELKSAEGLMKEYRQYMDERMEDESIVGDKLDSLAQSTGQMLATSAASMVGVPWWLITGATAGAGEAESALKEGATYEQALDSGIISGAAEVLSEKLFSGIKFGGKALDDALVTALSRGVSNKFVRNALKLGLDVTGEGLEEVVTSLASEFGQWLTYRNDESLKEIVFSEQALDEKIEAFFSGALMGGGSSASNLVISKFSGVDATSGLSVNEERVVNKLYKDRVAKAEKDGKITAKEKNKIYDEVVEAMDKGEISTEDIEDIVGGDSYREYKKAMDNQEDNAFLREYDELGSKRGATPKENAQYSEMTERAKQINENRKNLRSRLSQEVSDMVKGERLSESYRQKALRGVAFKADLTKVDEKQRAIYQKAMDSGVVNDSRRSHEFVDLVAKIAADKGVDFDFTNNERLKQSGFAVEGATINGYLNENGVTVNMQSAKALNTVVGHEITHVLEGTALYEDLQKAAFAYAESKGELTDRWKATKQLYKDLDSDAINKEIAADLIGEYIFTDSDFINRLYSGHRSTFEKIYDEIKYLCKVVTAGSKEARQLEKVKKAFADAYREGSKKQDGTRYSITGEKANLSEEVKANLQTAKKMKDSGKSIDEIYSETGWYTQSDGKWRTEIPDEIMVPDNFSRNGLQSVKDAEADAELAEAKELFEDGSISEATYKRLVNLAEMTRSDDIDSGKLTSFLHAPKLYEAYPKLKETSLWFKKLSGMEGYTDVRRNQIVLDPDGLRNAGQTVREGLSHEIQHIIQSIEGFAAGSNPKDAGSYEAYRKTGGEIEARDVESRLRMTPEERRNYMPERFSLSSMANTFFGDENMSSSEFMKKDYRETQGYKDYVDQCVYNMRQSRAGTGVEFDEVTARQEVESQISGIVKVAIAAKAAGYDILDDHRKRSKTDSKNRLLFSSLEPNSDYITSHDVSTICDKRQNFAEIYDDIVKLEEAKGVPESQRFFLKPDNYFYLHKLMADRGLTQPCRQCYVESMRKNLAPMADAFLKLVRETDPNNTKNEQLWQKAKKDATDYVTDANGNRWTQKASNTAKRNFVLEGLAKYDMSFEDLTVETLTTAEGLATLKITAPDIYEAFNSFYGQAKPKMPKSATPFRFGELTALLTDHNGEINKRLVERINHTGGFRLQSYSDFQIQNYTEVLQVLFEAGTLGLKGHAYTKVPAFLDATEGTNLKRNISIFMYKDGNEWKLDRNDSFPYTLEQIYDIVREDKSGNTGIIAVSQNADMSAWIMANDMVGYGIPFHKSGLKMGTVRDTIVREGGREIKGYSKIKDHTKQQTEVWKEGLKNEKGEWVHKKETKVKKGIDIYEFWDFDNKSNLSKNELIEKNVKNYIDACDDAGYLPKFREYVMNNGKVLADVLKYSKELGYTAKDATIDDISFEYKGYRIPYGYYKFLVDFGMFNPDGQAAPQSTLSLKDYDFDKAVKFFEDSEILRRNEMLQQFSNGEERQRYRDSNLTAEQLSDIIRQKRSEVAQAIVQRNIGPVKHSLSPENIASVHRGNYNITSEEVYFDPSAIAQVGENVVRQTTKTEPVSNSDESVNLSPKDRTKKFFFDEVMSLDKMPEEFRKRHGQRWIEIQRATENAQNLVVHGAEGVKPLSDIFQSVVDTGDFGEFERYMQHQLNMDAMSLNQRVGLKNKDVIGGVTAEMSRQEAATLEKAHPEFKELAQEIYDYNRFLRNVLVQSGKITQETADLWERRYPHYIPIKRAGFGNDFEVSELLGFMIENMEQVPDAENMDGFFQRVEDTAPVKARKGSDLPIQPLFDTLTERAMQTYWAAAMNGADMRAFAPVRSDVQKQATPAGTKVAPQIVQIETEKSTDPKILDVENEIMRKGRMNPIKWMEEFLVDNGMVFERLAKKTKDRGLEAKWNFVRNARGAAQHLIGHGDQAKGVKPLKDIFAAVEKTGAVEQFYEYLGHQRNLDGMSMRVRFGIPANQTMMGRSAAESIDAIFKMNEEHPEFKALAEETYKYSDNLLNMMVENGMITQSDADMVREIAPHWIPFNTVEGKIQPVFTTLAQETLKVQHQMALNNFGIHLKNTLGTVVGENPMSMREFMNSIEKGGNLVHFGGNGRYHTMTVLENGKAVTFEITDEMYTALKPTRDILSTSVPGLSHASTLRRNLITAYSLWFSAKNAIRDIQEVVVNSQHPVKTYAAIPQAIKEIRQKGDFYQEYVKNGGEQNTYFDTDSAEFGSGKGIMNALETKTGLSRILKANNFVEMVPRFAEYIASREAGASVEVAMLDAARVTTNFAAGGKLTKFLNRNGATFLNASVQGFVQQARNFAEAKQNGFKGWASLAARYAALGLPVVLLNNLIWDDDEDYQKLPDYITNNYYIVWKYGEGSFVRLPKGRTAAVMQNAIKQASADKVDWKEFWKVFGENIAPNNPLEDNIFAPVIQVGMNKTWYDESLVPNRLQKIDDVTQRFDEKTSRWAVELSKRIEDSWLGDHVDLSPKQIHYLMDQYSGVLGDTILPFTTPKAESPTDAGNLIAPVRDIFTTNSVLNDRVTGDFYETLEAVQSEAETPGSSRSVKLQNEILSNYNFRINELLQQQRDIQNSDLKDSEKYKQNLEIKKQINALQEEALAQYQNIRITGKYAEAADKRYNYSFNKNTGLNEWFEIRPKDADGSDNWFYQMEQGATKAFGISPAEYWNNQEEYAAAYWAAKHYDDSYFETVKNVLGIDDFARYADGMTKIYADKDKNGNSISGSRKRKMKDYVYGLNIPEIEKHILFKAEYNYNKQHDHEIRKYLDSLDLSSSELRDVLDELGMR